VFDVWFFFYRALVARDRKVIDLLCMSCTFSFGKFFLKALGAGISIPCVLLKFKAWRYLEGTGVMQLF